MSLLSSSFTWILLLTISLEENKSSRIALLQGCQNAAPGMLLLILCQALSSWLSILLWAIKTACFPLNFFSNSFTSQMWIFWKDQLGNWNKGYNSFLTTTNSVSLAIVMFSSCTWALRSKFMSSSSRAWEIPDSSSSGFSPLNFMILMLRLNMAFSLMSTSQGRHVGLARAPQILLFIFASKGCNFIWFTLFQLFWIGQFQVIWLKENFLLL